MPVDDVAELLRRWREAGGAWSRGRVLLDAAQLAGRLTPEERRTVAATLADTGAPDLARQLESRSGRPVDAVHLQAFADGLLELEGARLDQVIAALEVADARLADDAPQEDAGHDEQDVLPPPPPSGRRGAGTPQDEALDERLRDLAALEHLGDEELQGIRLGDIELGNQDLGAPELGQADLGETGLGEAGLGEVALREVSLGAAPGVATAAAAATPSPVGHDHADEVPAADRAVPAAAQRPEPATTPRPEPATEPAAVPSTAAAPGGETVTVQPGRTALVPAAEAPDDLTPRAAADALSTLSGRLTGASTATARLAALSPDVTGDLDAPAALLVLDQVPAGWQRRRAAQRLLAGGALTTVDPTALLARFPDARDRRFVAADLLAATDLAAEDLADDLPPQVVRRLAIRAER